MAPDLEQEAAFIRAFIIPSKRERLVELLGKPKRRQAVLSTLYHFADLDPRFISRVPAADDSAEGIDALLRSKGALEYFHGEEMGARYVLERRGRPDSVAVTGSPPPHAE